MTTKNKSNPTYSQYKQDLLIDKLLKRKNHGYFVDIGAHDGITYSNSYFFEHVRSYNGVCFEANPVVFETLTNNRTCLTIQGAVGASHDFVTFVKCTGFAEMLSGIKDFRDERHKLRTEEVIQKHGGTIEEIKVKSINLNQWLQEREIRNVDFISLDIEGGECEVLKTIDFSKINLSIMAVELNYPESEAHIRSLLRKNGFYLLFRCNSDGIFVKYSIRQYNILFLIELLVKQKFYFFKRIIYNFLTKLK